MADKRTNGIESHRWFRNQLVGSGTEIVQPNEEGSDIVVVGSCMIDLVSYVSRLPMPGETIHGTRFQQGFGGKGANQCVAATKLGASTALLAKLGCDNFGQAYLDELRKYPRLDRGHVSRVSDAYCGMASIFVTDSGGNQIVIVPGANDTLGPKDVDAASDLLKQARVVTFQGETPWSTTRYCLEILRDIPSVISIVNVAPAPSEPNEDLLHVLKLATIICVNEIEAELLTRVIPNSEPNIAECFVRLRELGARSSVVTLGGQGAVFFTEEDKSPQRVTVEEVLRPVDTTGAGDCFLGALAYYLAYFPSLTPAEQISRACKIASRSVMQRGTQDSFPSRCQLDDGLFLR